MDDMGGGPEAMSKGKMQVIKVKQEREAWTKEASRVVPVRMQNLHAEGKNLICQVNARPRGYRGENAASWFTSSCKKEGPIPMLEQTP